MVNKKIQLWMNLISTHPQRYGFEDYEKDTADQGVPSSQACCLKLPG